MPPFADSPVSTVIASGVVALAMTAMMTREAWAPGSSHWVRTLTAVLALAVWATATLPVMWSLRPSAPLANAEVTRAGERVALPPEVGGRVLITVRGEIVKEGPREVYFSLSGAAEPISGTLERTHAHFRRGARRLALQQERLVFRERSYIPPGVRELVVERLQGGLEGALSVEFHRDVWPPHVALPLGALLVAAAGALQVYGRWRQSAPWAGAALAFGFLVQETGVPGSGLGLVAGCAVLGIALGGPAGVAAVYVSRRALLRPRRSSAQSTSKGSRRVRRKP